MEIPGLFGTRINDETLLQKGGSVMISFICWLGLYALQRLLPNSPSPEWRCRIITAIHGAIVTFLALYSQFVEGPDLFDIEPGLPNNDSQTLVLKISLGYFMFDIAWVLWYQTEEPVMLVHHLVSLAAMILSCVYNRWGCELVGTMGGSEITNPLLQTRWFLKQSGLHKTLFAEVIDLLFIIMFGAVRLGLGTKIMVAYYTHPKPDKMGRFAGLSIYAISWIFWFYIMRYAYRKYTKMFFHKEAQINGIHETKKSN